MTASQTADLQSRCDLLRSLHRPGAPLLLPNAWDVATARAVVAAGFPVVATTSGGVAATLGYEDHEGAPADEMLAAAARIARGVEVPVTVDAEAGYGMEPAELVAALRSAGAAGCNLEDTDHAAGSLRDPDRHAEWLAGGSPGRVGGRLPARDQRPGRRLPRSRSSPAPAPGPRRSSFPKRCGARMPTSRPASTACTRSPCGRRTRCAASSRRSGGPVNVVRLPQAPSLAELAALGVARVSWGHPAVPRRDGSLRGAARLASGVTTSRIVDLDDAVHRRANGDPAERAGDVVGGDAVHDSKNCVARTIEYGIEETSISSSCASFARR